MPKLHPDTKPKKLKGLGAAIESDRRKINGRPDRAADKIKASGVAASQAARSVLEQSSLDDFLSTAELARATFEAERGGPYHIKEEDGPRIVSTTIGSATAAQERRAAALAACVPVPRRPPWQEGMSADELTKNEGEAFLTWRRTLARMEEEQDIFMTPYERNLEFWRQLWRCVERSELLVQILDARDPEFYRSQDLEKYVKELAPRRHLLLLNKADFLTPELRERWAAYLKERGTDALFFSAVRELHRQQRLAPSVSSVAPASSSSAGFASAGNAAPAEEVDKAATEKGATTETAAAASGDSRTSAAPTAEVQLPPHGPLGADFTDVLDCAGLVEEIMRRLPPIPEDHGSRDGGSLRRTVGFVGYPNVGKSSVINALIGAKKVSMSRTPGKTKHLQTLEMVDGLTLCDCPGLVFPSVVATKSHLAINGTMPIDELRDFVAPVSLIIQKVGLGSVLEHYGLGPEALRQGERRRGDHVASAGAGDASEVDSGHALLAGIAAARQHFLRLGVPDETWAARRVLKDYCTGALLHCEPPPGCAKEPLQAQPAAAGGAQEPPAFQPPARGQATSGEAVPTGSDSEDFDDLDDFLRGAAAKEGDLQPKVKRKGAKNRK